MPKNQTPLTPGWREVIVDKQATSDSVKYYRETSDDIHSRVGPYANVSQRAFTFYKHNPLDWLSNRAKQRADGTESSGSGFEYIEQADVTPNYSHHSDLSIMQDANADELLGLRQDKIILATAQMSTKREVEFDKEIMPSTATYYNGTSSATTPETKDWTQSNSNPIKDIRDDRLAIKGKWGRMPNTLIIGAEAYEVLREHPKILERFTGGATTERPAVLGQGDPLIANFLGVDRIWVAAGSVANENETEASFINASKGLLCYLPADGTNTRGGLTTFRTYVFNSIPGTDARTGIRSSNFYMPHIEATRYESSMSAKTVIEFPQLGHSYASLTG